MPMNISTSKCNCSACTACVAICPKGAITMAEDADGFLYPAVEESKCVHCGLCEQVCAYRNALTPHPAA